MTYQCNSWSSSPKQNINLCTHKKFQFILLHDICIIYFTNQTIVLSNSTVSNIMYSYRLFIYVHSIFTLSTEHAYPYPYHKSSITYQQSSRASVGIARQTITACKFGSNLWHEVYWKLLYGRCFIERDGWPHRPLRFTK